MHAIGSYCPRFPPLATRIPTYFFNVHFINLKSGIWRKNNDQIRPPIVLLLFYIINKNSCKREDTHTHTNK